jgi:outer membrane protein OmpA-like peptidoglycan-associated protein
MGPSEFPLSRAIWGTAVARALYLIVALTVAAGCSTFGHHSQPEFNVFFHSGSAQLTPEAAEIVDSAAISIMEGHPDKVIVSAGSAPGDNLQFAEARFKTVQGLLVAKGVDPAVLVRATLVESPVELGATADRRVEIKLMKTSGL